jgi:D-alanyl-D-alanine carboxypeptidase
MKFFPKIFFARRSRYKDLKGFHCLLYKISFCIFLFLTFYSPIYSESQLGAKAYVLGNLETGKILFQKNKDSHYPIASIAKLPAALALENEFSDSEYILVPDKKLYKYEIESRAGIEVGEEYKYNDLLYGLLLPSGNDVARVLDWKLEDRNKKFTEIAKNWTKKNGLSHTVLEEPIGLSSNTVSTSNELWKILLITYNHKKIYNILQTTEKEFFSKKGKSVKVFTRNKILEHKGFLIRGKTGTTKKAGECFVGFLQKDKKIYGIVLLGAKNINQEIPKAVKLLEN